MNDKTQNWGFWKTASIYGTPAGLLVIGMMIGSFTFFGFKSDASSMAVGFLLMILAFSLVFLGIRRFRDQEQGGFIKFSKAFILGLAMVLFSGLAYVLVWEIYTAVTGNAFIGQYMDHLIELEQAKDISAEALSEFVAKVEAKETKYINNPLYRMSVTFSEIASMGLIVSLLSALGLHNPKFWKRP